MICPNGSECTETNHEVKTIDKAREWWPEVRESDLPIAINQIKAANGRMMVKVFNSNNEVIFKRG